MDTKHKPNYTLLPTIKPKTVLFYKNGDRNFRGYHVSVTQRRFNNFQNLLSELTRVTNLAQGARYVFTPNTGTRIQSLDELTDGQSYVCGSIPKLKKINYSHAPDGSNRKKGNKNFIPTHSPSKLEIEKDRLAKNLRPRIITIIRSTMTRQKRIVKILLNKRTAQTYDQVLNDITATVGVEGGTGVRKLYNIDGNLIQSLPELFGEDDIFIAVGSEKFRQSDIVNILHNFGIDRAYTQKKAEFRNSTFSLLNPSDKPFSYNKPFPKPLQSNSLPNNRTKKRNPFITNGSSQPKMASFTKLPEIKSPLLSKTTNNNDNSCVDTTLENTHFNFDEPSFIMDELKLNLKTYASIDEKFNERKPDTSSSEPNSFKFEHDYSNELEYLNCSDALDNKITNSSESLKSNTSKKHQEFSSESSCVVGKETAKDVSDSDENISVSNSKQSTQICSTSSKSTEASKHIIETSLTVSSKSSMKEGSDHHKKVSSDDESQNNTLEIIKNNTPSFTLDCSRDINNFYELGQQLGDGNFAVVKVAIDQETGERFAVKIIDRSKIRDKQDMLENEIRLQRASLHPNIVRLFHDYRSPTEIFLTMELILGGDFFDLIAESGNLEEDEAAPFFRDLCSGLDYLHRRNIVHRDIKPENLMVHVTSSGDQMLKIADFGLAMEVGKPIFVICGTPTYVAPEILAENGYGLEVDMWAAGVIVYIMLCGFPPFRSPNRKQTELFDLIEAGKFEFLDPYWDDVSELAKDLVNRILIVNAKERYTATDVLKHKWITQHKLKRNATLESFDSIVTRNRISRFRAVAKGVQSIQRMKNMTLERGESFISSNTSSDSDDE